MDYEKGILRIAFSLGRRFDRELCQKHKEKVESLFGAVIGTPVALEFKTDEQADGESDKQTGSSTSGRIDKKKREEVLSDPAVKTLLSGLDATIVRIDEAKEE